MRLLGYKSIPRWMALLMCAIVLTVLLTACGGGSTTTGSTPTTAAKPSPTTQATTPASTSSFVTYKGSDFTINYPQGWKASAAGTKVTFTDSTGAYYLAIGVSPDPGGLASADTVASVSIQAVKASLKNPQTVNVPSKATIGGDSWVQKSISGTSSATGQVGIVQLVVASDNHPANSPSTKSFTVVYVTLQLLFDAVNSQYYQPMLQSFKFTA